jgi:hypothetical protein
MPAPFARFAAIGLTTLGLASVGYAQKKNDVVPASGSVPAQPVRAVAYIYGTVAITREDLADFLIARGGYEKVDLLINRKIIEIECAKKGVTVTPQEMEAVLSEDMKGLGFSKDQFLEQLLPRYNKTYYEWMEDVIKPRIQLKKLCQDQVKVTEEDIKKQFDSLYGEKRRVQMVMWPKSELKVAHEQYAQARKSQEEFDRVARNQGNPSLAAAAGHVLPISKHQAKDDPMIEKIAFELKVGEISHIQEVKNQGYVILKLHEIIPPAKDVTFESKKAELEKAAFEKKVEEMIPTYFAGLKEAAAPTKPLVGQPAEWQMQKRDR